MPAWALPAATGLPWAVGAAAPGDTVLPDANFRSIIFLVNTTVKFIISMQLLSLHLNPLG